MATALQTGVTFITQNLMIFNTVRGDDNTSNDNIIFVTLSASEEMYYFIFSLLKKNNNKTTTSMMFFRRNDGSGCQWFSAHVSFFLLFFCVCISANNWRFSRSLTIFGKRRFCISL